MHNYILSLPKFKRDAKSKKATWEHIFWTSLSYLLPLDCFGILLKACSIVECLAPTWGNFEISRPQLTVAKFTVISLVAKPQIYNNSTTFNTHHSKLIQSEYSCSLDGLSKTRVSLLSLMLFGMLCLGLPGTYDTEENLSLRLLTLRRNKIV